jgi:hypothetical protein
MGSNVSGGHAFSIFRIETPAVILIFIAVTLFQHLYLINEIHNLLQETTGGSMFF